MLSMSRKSLVDYSILTQDNYEPNWHHNEIAKVLESVAAGNEKRVMIFMPPRHGKSELASVKFPAWYLGKFPDREVLCCSYSAELAEEFARKTRQTVDNEIHRAIFPKCQLQIGSKSVSKWKVSARGGFRGTGVGGSITGVGANVLIIDDPLKNREEAESDLVRGKIYDWYTSTAFTRLEKNGAVIIIMTRWHDDDLAGRLLDLQGEKGYYYNEKEDKWIKGAQGQIGKKIGKWKVVNFPAIAMQQEEHRKIDEALWPSKYDKEALLEIKASIGLRDWGALYQQDPVLAEGAEFQASWFKYWKELPKTLRYVTTVDPAISKKATADDSVVLTAGISADGRIYVVESKNWKANPDELINEIFRQQKEYNSLVAVETVAYQQSLIHYMQVKMRLERSTFHVEQVYSNTKKEEKIRGLIPYYSNGLIFHAPGGSNEMEDQLKRFPNGKHDDIIDALSMTIPYLRKPGKASNSKKSPIQTIGIRYNSDGTAYIEKPKGIIL